MCARGILCTHPLLRTNLPRLGTDRKHPKHAKISPQTAKPKGGPPGVKKIGFNKNLSYSFGCFPREKTDFSRGAARTCAIKAKVTRKDVAEKFPF